jgi:hypothetical protein
MHSEALPGLKAPREHGAILSFPPLDDVGRLSAANAQRIAAWSYDFGGISLAQLRELARHEAVAVAQRYLEEAGEPAPSFGDGPLFIAGHQPELFHPGVWIKNFALQALARRHGAVPLNLVVDNDNVKTAALRVPRDERVVKVPFDRWQAETPYEERRVADESLWASLAERVRPLTRAWTFQPMLPDFWAEAVRQRARTPLLGERLARARRMTERAWGLTPLEAPLSRLCGTTSFARFAVDLLRQLPRFHAAYNAAVRGYRRRHGLRSDNHPAPDLAEDDGWLEAPFWAWRTGSPRRQRLFARAAKDEIHLRIGSQIGPTLTGDAAALAARFATLQSEGYKVRTRALTTTLFSRLLLGNLFIHGIGGGKYDEVTDELFRAFYGLAPTGYLVLSATMLLPLDRHPDADAERRRLKQLQRDLVWNPQRHLQRDAALVTWAAEKKVWIGAATATRAQRQERYRRLRDINERLQPLVASQQADVHRRLAEAERLARSHDVNSSREYAFCLFPENTLRQFFQDAIVHSSQRAV